MMTLNLPVSIIILLIAACFCRNCLWGTACILHILRRMLTNRSVVLYALHFGTLHNESSYNLHCSNKTEYLFNLIFEFILQSKHKSCGLNLVVFKGAYALCFGQGTLLLSPQRLCKQPWKKTLL